MKPRYTSVAERKEWERRKQRRYKVALKLAYTVNRGKTVLEAGTGATTDISSGGVAFSCERQLPRGVRVELKIEWPVLLNEARAMMLVVSGRVVRTEGTDAAIRVKRREFRVAGGASAHAAGSAGKIEFLRSVAAAGKLD